MSLSLSRDKEPFMKMFQFGYVTLTLQHYTEHMWDIQIRFPYFPLLVAGNTGILDNLLKELLWVFEPR